MNRVEAARELLRRHRARESLHTYALSIDIPTVPTPALCPDEDLLGPAEFLMAKHHAKILEVLDRTYRRPFGRAILMLPPGSAKSLYSVIGVTREMARCPGGRYIYTSYQSGLAERQSRRAQAVAQQQQFRDLWPTTPVVERDAAKEWTLRHTTGHVSEMLAMGITAGLTGNRANGAVVDDPVAGREEADSELTRQKILDAYQDDLLTRLLPGAWLVLIMTRWHEADLAGSILPEDYDGRSGMIKCRDGLDWEVLNIPAKCERADDPLGREIGEYLWPEFYPPQHWQMFENAQGGEAARTWASLYQQRPTPKGSGRFDESMFHFYDPKELPPMEQLVCVGASDHAVTEGKNDFTEAGVFAVDTRGELWEVDWWNKQCGAGEGAEKVLEMAARWKTPMWFNEGGVIDKAMRPLFNLRQRELGAQAQREGRAPFYVDIRALPSMQDKLAKCASFQGRAAAGGQKDQTTWNQGVVHFRNNANSRRIVNQLVALPAGRYDDAADVCGLIGRACDQHIVPRVATVTRKEGIKPFSAAWLEYQEKQEPNVRYR